MEHCPLLLQFQRVQSLILSLIGVSCHRLHVRFETVTVTVTVLVCYINCCQTSRWDLEDHALEKLHPK